MTKKAYYLLEENDNTLKVNKNTGTRRHYRVKGDDASLPSDSIAAALIAVGMWHEEKADQKKHEAALNDPTLAPYLRP